MIKIILVGCNGKMGSAITAHVNRCEDIEISAGVDKFHGVARDYPVYDSIAEVEGKHDVIIDFSNPDANESIVKYAVETGTPVVICTTGLNEAQTENIKSASKKVGVFFSFNMSLGVNLIVELSKKAAAVLGDDFDIEIIEQHHNQKIDAPSGTAYMLANAINETLDNQMQYNYDRHSVRRKRDSREIGIHSVRGGNIVGEHEVIFAGTDEVVTISHSARSKEVFATGAVNAARFLCGKGAGLYSMKDIID